LGIEGGIRVCDETEDDGGGCGLLRRWCFEVAESEKEKNPYAKGRERNLIDE